MIQQITLRFAAVDDAAWPGIPEHELHASSLQGLLFQTALPLYRAAEAAWLHEHPSPKPYALAPLYGPGRALRGLRISSWSARATEALLEGWQRVYEQGVVLQLGQRNRFVVEEGRYATAVSFLQLLAPKPRPNMTLHFISPTAFRRGPRRLHLPLPANVFARPAQVWQTYAPESLRLPDDWGDWCEQHVMAHTLHIHTRQAPLNANAFFIGFVGRVTFTAQGQQEEYLRLWQGLGRLAAYCGIGYKTTMGLGAVRYRIYD